MKTYSAMWTYKLGQAIGKASVAPYPVEFHPGSADYQSFCQAVNQGIDSHLEAIMFSEQPGSWGRVKFIVHKSSVRSLVRRLLESGEDNDTSLARSICQTLDIELI